MEKKKYIKPVAKMIISEPTEVLAGSHEGWKNNDNVVINQGINTQTGEPWDGTAEVDGGNSFWKNNNNN